MRSVSETKSRQTKKSRERERGEREKERERKRRRQVNYSKLVAPLFDCVRKNLSRVFLKEVSNEQRQ